MAAAELGRTKRCLYEVLGVARECSPEEIRSAYRKLALQLHPDKLAQSGAAPSEDATAAFQDLLHAYEVLSDPRERTWYDSHRSEILFSDPSLAASKSSSPFGVDLFSYFTTAAYSGFSDKGRGFYKVYGDLFDKIYNQELRFARELGLGPGAVEPPPLIGNLDSPYQQAAAFYDYWLGFSTVMDFAWADVYDCRAGPNRRARREMEEENKKLRKKARREFNETVRGLASFAKKRDRRVVEMQAKKKAEEVERRQAAEKKRKEEERKKLERARMYEEPEWAQIDEDAEEMMNDGLYDSESDERKKKKNKGKDGEELYCVICSKKFKSDKQWKNHEQSKKHREKVVELRESMQDEEEVLMGVVGNDCDDDDGEGVRVGFDYVPEPEEDSGSNAVDELREEFEDGFKVGEEPVRDDVEVLGSEDEASVLTAMLSRHKGGKAVNLELDKTYNDGGEGEGSMEYDTREKGRRNWAAKKGNRAKAGAEYVERRESNGTCQDDIEVGQQEDPAEDTKEAAPHSSGKVGTSSRGDMELRKNQKLKKQQADGKEGMGKKETDTILKNSTKGKKQKGTSKAPNNACGTCGESFGSRNKLFMHLGDTGHAMLKSR